MVSVQGQWRNITEWYRNNLGMHRNIRETIRHISRNRSVSQHTMCEHTHSELIIVMPMTIKRGHRLQQFQRPQLSCMRVSIRLSQMWLCCACMSARHFSNSECYIIDVPWLHGNITQNSLAPLNNHEHHKKNNQFQYYYLTSTFDVSEGTLHL